jgi:branched-chain amino acid transport system ATP-binding protein
VKLAMPRRRVSADLETIPFPSGAYDGSALLSCRGVDVAYDKVQVLFGVDVDIRHGEIVALLGTNGAGKSTLLKAVSGLVHPIGGRIMFDGHDITDATPSRTTELGIVQVPGGKAVFPTLTVAEHFKAGQWLYARQASSEVAERTDKVLEMFPRVKERWGNLAGDLSGGEQQQLAVGMAFVARPKLLVIDELSLGLAPIIVERLLDAVRAIHAEGATVVLVEQSVNVALTLASRAYFMEKGQVRFEGATADLLDRDDVLRSVFLDRANKSMTADAPKARTRTRTAAAEAAQRKPVLEVRGLTKAFGGINAVTDVSFTVHDHEILGLIGPNGAGKTTIFDMISGHLPNNGGRIMLAGQDITGWAPEKRAAIGLGRSFQDARIFPSLTVAENIAIGLERHIEVRDHVSALFSTPAMRESETDVAFTVDDLIELMGLGAFRDKFVAELSTGSRRIVDLAMSIAHDPTVLLLDEPSSGIAQRETEALGPLLRRIREEAGCALLVIEHDMPLITSLSDSIVALDLGQVLMQGPPSDVLADERVVNAYLGNDPASINRSTGASAPAKRATRSRTKVAAR